jgi:hypothetical protein
MQEDAMATLTHESHDQLMREQARDRNESYHTNIIVGFGIAMILVVIAAYALAVSSGIDSSQIALMSVFP